MYLITYCDFPKNCLGLYDSNFEFVKWIEGFKNIRNGLRGIGSTGTQGKAGRGYVTVSESNIYFLNNKLELVETLEDRVVDGHGIFVYNVNNWIYIVSTGENSIKVYNYYFEQIIADFYPYLPKEAHINSIHNNYITVHNRDNEGYIIKAQGGHSFVALRGLSQPHDFQIHPFGWIVNNSGKNEVICSKVPIEKSWVVKTAYYNRGLLVEDNKIIVLSGERHDPANEVLILDYDGNTLLRKQLIGNERGCPYGIVKI